MECSIDEYKQMKQNRRNPHVHAELIKLWADGAIIQYRHPSLNVHWTDCPNNKPNWDTDTRNTLYRVKPPTISYRTFLWRPSLNPGRLIVAVCSNHDNDAEPREQWAGFIRWVGNWQEVEV